METINALGIKVEHRDFLLMSFYADAKRADAKDTTSREEKITEIIRRGLKVEINDLKSFQLILKIYRCEHPSK